MRGSLLTIIALLVSARVKERNDALERLNQINFNSNSILQSMDRQTVLLMIDSLHKFISIEKQSFEKSETAQTMDRLAKSSSIFRTIIKSCLIRFTCKQKQLDYIVNIILNNFCLSNGDLFKPVISSFVQSLTEFLSCQQFFDTLTIDTHKKIINLTLRALTPSVSIIDDNLLSSFLELLLVFWCPNNTTTLNIMKLTTGYHTRLIQLFITYTNETFDESRKEKSSLILIFRLINNSIIHLTNVNTKMCHILSKIGMNFILEIKSITYPKLIKELALFINISSSFLSLSKLPKILGDNWNINKKGQLLSQSATPDGDHQNSINESENIIPDSSIESMQEVPNSEDEDDDKAHYSESERFSSLPLAHHSKEIEFLSDLAKCIETIIDLVTNDPRCFNLPVDCIEVFIFGQMGHHGWFTNRYMTLNSERFAIPWLLRCGLINLVATYYDLESSLNVDFNTNKSPLVLKRRKLNSHLSTSHELNINKSVSVTLKSSETPMEFFISMIEINKSEKTTILMLQSLTFFQCKCAATPNLNSSYQGLRYILDYQNNNFALKLINLFEMNYDSFNVWIMLSLNIFFNISQDFKFEENELDSKYIDRLLKYSIEFLKDSKLGKLASRLLIFILLAAEDEKFKFGQAIIQQLENVIDLSEISGPHNMSLESNLLWVLLLSVCMNYKFKNIEYRPKPQNERQLYSHKMINWISSKDLSNLTAPNDILSTCQLIFWLLSKKPFKLSSQSFQFNQIYDGDLVDYDYRVQDELELANCTMLIVKFDSDIIMLNSNKKKFEFNQIPLCVSYSDLLILESKLKNFIYQLVDFKDSLNAKILCLWTLSISIFIDQSKSPLFLDLFDRFSRIDTNDLKEFHIELIDFIPKIKDDKWVSKISHLLKISKILEKVHSVLDSERLYSTSKRSKDFETQIMDELFIVKDENDIEVANELEFNPKVFNWKMHFRKSNEQKLIKSFIAINKVDHDINYCVFKILNLKWKNEGPKLATMLEIYEYLTCNDIKAINAKSFKLILSSYLSLSENRFEFIISLCCKVLSYFFTGHVTADCQDIMPKTYNVYSFFKSLNDKHLIHNIETMVDFFNLNICILKANENLKPEFNTDEILMVTNEVLNNMTNLERFKVSISISSLIKAQSLNDQFHYYEFFTKTFKTPYTSCETSATFNIYMGQISRASDSLLLATVCNLIEFADFFQMRAYFGYFKKLVPFDINKIFYNFNVVFFHQFIQFGKRLLDFPFEFFGFKHKNDFIKKNYKILTTLLLLNNNHDNDDAVEEISRLSNISVANLLKDSLSIILSHTNDLSIIQSKYPKFSKSLKSLLKEQLSLVIYQLIMRCDVSKENYLNELDQYNLSQEIISPYSSNEKDIAFLNEYGISLSGKKVNALIDSFMGQSKVKSWSVPLMYNVLSKILFVLKNSILEIEVKINIRRLKYLFMKAPSLFGDHHLNSLLILNLMKYLLNENLQNDVAQFIITLINFGPPESTSIVLKIWIPLICELLSIGKGNEKIDELISLIGQFIKDPIFASFNFVIKPSMDKLNDHNFLLDFENLLSIFNCGLEIDEMRSIVKILPFLFPRSAQDNNNLWDFEKYKDKISIEIIQRIFDIQNRFLSLIKEDNLKLWIGKILGKSYELHGEVPFIKIEEFQKDIFNKYSKSNFEIYSKSIDYIFEMMIDEFPIYGVDNMHARLCFESIIGVIIQSHNDSHTNISNYVSSYHDLIKPFEKYILPLNNYTCSLSISNFERRSIRLYYKCDLKFVLNGFGTNLINTPFDEGLVKIVFALINDLNSKTTIFSLLTTYIVQVPEFSKRCFCPLIIYFIENNKDEKNKLISRMLLEFFEQDFNRVPQDAIEIFCELVLLIRSGCNCQNSKIRSKFINVYSKLKISKVFSALEYIGKYKASLLLLEDFFTNSVDIDRNSWKKSTDFKSFLKSVYNGIGEPDLLMGIPIDPNLDYGLSILESNCNNNGKLIFENGKLEVDLKTSNEIPHNDISNFADDLMSIGWLGVSKLLNDNLGLDSIDYSKMWKLNQWDLPKTENFTNENEIIYNVFKEFNDLNKFDSSVISSSFDKSIVSIIDQSQVIKGKKCLSLKSWMKSLSIVNNLSEIAQKEDNIDFQNVYQRNTRWFKHSELENFEDLILSRQVMYHMLNSNSLMENGNIELEVNELHRFNELLLLKGEKQKLVNTSIHLDRINKMIQDTTDNLQIETTSRFNLALAFWVEHSDLTFPVSTLKIIIERNFYNLDQNSLRSLNVPYMSGILTQWLNESKQDTPNNIMKNYIDPALAMIEHNEVNFGNLGKTYQLFAEFCDEQIKSNKLKDMISKIETTIKRLHYDIITLKKSPELSQAHQCKESKCKEPRCIAKRKINSTIEKCEVKYSSKREELKRLKREKSNLIKKAMEFYLQAISFEDPLEEDNINVDRFCGLWMENEDCEIDSKLMISSIPSYKFLPWTNQLTSRLMDRDSYFQRCLQKLIFSISLWHPFQTLYTLKSLRMNGSKSNDPTVKSRGDICDKIWSKLMTSKLNVLGFDGLLSDIDLLCEKMVEICEIKVSKQLEVDIENFQFGKWWIDELPLKKLPSPVNSINVKTDGGAYEHRDIETLINAVNTKIEISTTGISKPKIMTLLLSNGQRQKVLLKDHDDLRQDAIMEQVFSKVNKLFKFDSQTKRRLIQMRTYNVLPLGPQNGIIEFVSSSNSMMHIISKFHPKSVIDESRIKIDEVANESIETKLEVYKEICQVIQPKFRNFFFGNFITSDEWFNSRLIYSHGLAVCCIIGYILGIGDRHLNNILLDSRTGEPIQIDFGIAFDQGKSLPIPETVPFRLTRELVDGLGISGVEGSFTKSSEHIMRVLRERKRTILDVLDVLRYDPLYSWTLSPLRKRKLMAIYKGSVEGLDDFFRSDSTSEANTAITGVKEKLEGMGLGNDAIVRGLVREAMDEANLCQLFKGWSAFL